MVNINNEYAKAYREVIEVLKYVPDEDVAKIPKEKIEFYKKNMDISYDYKIDEEKEFDEQVISNKTVAILANIFRDYWATPYQRERIIAKQKHDLEKMEEEKRVKYNSNNLFKNKQTNEKLEEIRDLPVEVKKENIFQRLIKFIKKILSNY